MENQFKVSEWNRQTAAFGLRHLAEAFGSRSDSPDDFVRCVKQCLRYLNEFLGDVIPAPTLTEAEANVSQNLHTWLRKGSDDHFSVILYRMIHESRGVPVWYAFVKAACAAQNSVRASKKNKEGTKLRDSAKYIFRQAITAAETENDKRNLIDDTIMLQALWMWEDTWEHVYER